MRWRGEKSFTSTSLARTQISSSSKSEKSGTERSVSGLQPIEITSVGSSKIPAAFHKHEGVGNCAGDRLAVFTRYSCLGNCATQTNGIRGRSQGRGKFGE